MPTSQNMYPYMQDIQEDADSSSDHHTQYGPTVDLNLNLSPPHLVAPNLVNYVKPIYPPPGQQFPYLGYFPHPAPPAPYGYWPGTTMYYPPSNYQPYRPAYMAPASAPPNQPAMQTESELQPGPRTRRSARSRLGSQGAGAPEEPRQETNVHAADEPEPQDNRTSAFERLRPEMRQRLGPQDPDKRSVDSPMRAASQAESSGHSGPHVHRRRRASPDDRAR
ncbi:PREDICTED: trithorax group protein osa-like [Ipomoea nil]|uniref:trithorax group protein osa-like n=1 Tax=Ipomoea nil TaxID=35883 RepID=UPI000901B1AF|nr:PREDICTED: trithorax group protein osa-like [Ipomoea nil]